MKFCRLVLFVPFTIASIWAAPAANDLVLPEKIFPKLDNILRVAVQQSPDMLNRALDLEIAEAARIQARSNLLPTLSGGISFYKSYDTTKYLYSSPTTGSNSSNSYLVTKTPYNISLSQPVYFWGEKRNLDRIGAIQQQIAKKKYREGYRQLVQELRSGYMQLILQKLRLNRARFYQEYMVSQLKEQEAQLVKKAISEAQIFDPRILAEQAQIAMERAEYDYANATAAFGRLAGTGPIADDDVADAVPAATYDAAAVDQLLAGFLAEKDPPTTEAALLREQLKIENLQYANAKTRLRPKISATVALSKDQQNNLYGTGLDYSVASVYGGLSLSWTIFDGFASSAAVRTALASRRHVENTYLQVSERLARDAQTQVKLINFAARNAAITEKYLTSAEGFLRLRKEENQRGVRAEAEVSQAQTNLYDVQFTAMTARVDFLQKVSEFLGTIMEDPALSNVNEK